MNKKMNIQDVARLAGVSKATVSRVLNNLPTVDPDLRERVLRVIKEYDFVPSINALGLNGRSQLLGILTPRYLWTALQSITWGISGYVSGETRYEIILYSSSNNEEGYSKVLDQIIHTKLVAGLIATLYDHSPRHLEELSRRGLPVVLVDTVGVASSLPTIGVDHYGGAYQAMQHLLALGHRRIGYIHGPDVFRCSRERYQAYKDVLQEYDITPDPELFQQGNFTPATGIQAARALLSLPERPTAIFASNDDMAYGTMAVAGEMGIRVPDELSVVGFNDDPTPFTQLTTVRQPFTDMGRCAAELLVALLQKQHIFSPEWQRIIQTASNAPDAASLTASLTDETQPFQINLPTTFVVRHTTARPPED